jgi:hypothetical protein
VILTVIESSTGTISKMTKVTPLTLNLGLRYERIGNLGDIGEAAASTPLW